MNCPKCNARDSIIQVQNASQSTPSKLCTKCQEVFQGVYLSKGAIAYPKLDQDGSTAAILTWLNSDEDDDDCGEDDE